MPEPVFLLLFALLGCVVGFAAGLLGIGGGGISVPVLTAIFLAMGIDERDVVHLALGTTMAAMVVTSFSSMRSHWRKGNVLLPLVYVLTPGVLMGTFAATFLASSLNSRALAIFFACFMAFVAFQMLRAGREGSHGRSLLSRWTLFLGALMIGAISAMVSIGGGSLTVPFLHWQSVDIKKAIGTSSAVGFPIAIAGSLGYIINGSMARMQPTTQELTLGFVHLPAAILLASTSYFFAPVGASTAQKLNVIPLKRIFGVLALALALKMAHSVM